MKKYALLLSLIPLYSCANVTNIKEINDNSFKNCISSLKPQAIKNGVSIETYDKYTKNLTPDMSVIEKLSPKKQPEVAFSISKYITALVSVGRILTGKEMLVANKETLEKINEKYGVPPNVVISVWGVESNYGKNFGSYPIVQSLGTLSCFGRRQEFFRKEWISSLRILQEGNFEEYKFKGSWAGAFGHTQFMPTTFEKIAVDFDGDGKRDLLENIPDALASTANYLKQAGWQNNMKWGYEVIVPKTFTLNVSSRKDRHLVSYWKGFGITLADGSPLPSDLPETGLILNDSIMGKSYLVTKNFESIYKYNASEKYALAIGLLSDSFIDENVFKEIGFPSSKILEEDKSSKLPPLFIN